MASMLVAILTTAVVGGITTVVAADVRNQQKLEALELGNRLLLQYLDDKEAMPHEEQHIDLGQRHYRWHLKKTPVTIEVPDESIITKPAENTPGAQTLAKTELLTVTVYAGVPDGMGGFVEGTRLCTLSRLNHPLSVIYRNPDTMMRAFSDPIKAMTIFRDLISTSGPSTPAPAPAASNTSAGTRSTTGSTAGARAPKPSATRNPEVRTDDGTVFEGARKPR